MVLPDPSRDECMDPTDLESDTIIFDRELMELMDAAETFIRECPSSDKIDVVRQALKLPERIRKVTLKTIMSKIRQVSPVYVGHTSTAHITPPQQEVDARVERSLENIDPAILGTHAHEIRQKLTQGLSLEY